MCVCVCVCVCVCFCVCVGWIFQEKNSDRTTPRRVCLSPPPRLFKPPPRLCKPPPKTDLSLLLHMISIHDSVSVLFVHSIQTTHTQYRVCCVCVVCSIYPTHIACTFVVCSQCCFFTHVSIHPATVVANCGTYAIHIHKRTHTHTHLMCQSYLPFHSRTHARTHEQLTTS